MSLLLAQGHRHARRYPVGMVWSEVRFVRRRITSDLRTETVLLHAAVAAVLAGPKHLNETLRSLDDG